MIVQMRPDIRPMSDHVWKMYNTEQRVKMIAGNRGRFLEEMPFP
jgi:hypothetical protein